MVKLQLLLRKSWRNPEGIGTVQSVMRELGIKPTVSGAASVSAEVNADVLASMFGLDPSRDNPLPPALSGIDARELPVPGPLREYVESITVAPRHTLFQDTEPDKNKG